jgi:hypothetical protein
MTASWLTEWTARAHRGNEAILRIPSSQQKGGKGRNIADIVSAI